VPRRNDRTETGYALNQCCVLGSFLESILLEQAPKIFFDSIGQQATLVAALSGRAALTYLARVARHFVSPVADLLIPLMVLPFTRPVYLVSPTENAI